MWFKKKLDRAVLNERSRWIKEATKFWLDKHEDISLDFRCSVLCHDKNLQKNRIRVMLFYLTDVYPPFLFFGECCNYCVALTWIAQTSAVLLINLIVVFIRSCTWGCDGHTLGCSDGWYHTFLGMVCDHIHTFLSHFFL